MKKAITLFESIQPVCEEIRKFCISYLRRVLKNTDNKTILFYDNDGNAIDDEYVSVASDASSNVNSVYLNKKGRIVLNTDDCDEYEIENLSYDEVYVVAEYVYQHALPYWKNA